MKRVTAILIVCILMVRPVMAQDDGGSLQQQMIDAMKRVDALQAEANAANQRAQDAMTTYGAQTAEAQTAINQANAAIAAANAQIEQVRASQSQTALALKAAQDAQQAVANQQAGVATALAGQSATLAVQASRDAASVIRDQYLALNLANEAKTKAQSALTAYRAMAEAMNQANTINLKLYEAKSAYAEMAITQANNELAQVRTQAESLAQNSGRQQAWLILSAVLNLLAIAALIVVAIRFRPMIIERIRPTEQPVVVENEPPKGVVILPPLNDVGVFDALMRETE